LSEENTDSYYYDMFKKKSKTDDAHKNKTTTHDEEEEECDEKKFKKKSVRAYFYKKGKRPTLKKKQNTDQSPPQTNKQTPEPQPASKKQKERKVIPNKSDNNTKNQEDNTKTNNNITNSSNTNNSNNAPENTDTKAIDKSNSFLDSSLDHSLDSSNHLLSGEKHYWIHKLMKVRLALYSELPKKGMFAVLMGNIIVQFLESTEDEDCSAISLDESGKNHDRASLAETAGNYYSLALERYPQVLKILSVPKAEHHYIVKREYRTDKVPRHILARYDKLCKIFTLAENDKKLRTAIAKGYKKLLEMESGVLEHGLFFAPVGSHLSDKLLSVIVAALTENGNEIRALSLSGCSKITGKCLVNFVDKISDTLQMIRFKALSDTTLNEGNKFCEFIEKCKQIVHLSLPNWCLKDTYHPLNSISTYCPSLKSLDFGYINHICETDWEQVASGCSNITKLDFSHCPTVTFTIVVYFLVHCKKLIHLSLPSFLPTVIQQYRNQASDRGIDPTDEYAKMTFKKNDNDRILVRHKATIANFQILKMDGLSRKLPLFANYLNHNLKVLSMEGNTFVGDAELSAIAQQCPNLIRLNVAHCFKIGDASLSMVAIHCIKLRFLFVSLTKIGLDSMKLFAKYCKYLNTLSLGSPSYIRDDDLKKLIYNHFPKLRKLHFFRSAIENEFKFTVSAARTRFPVVEVIEDFNTLLPAFCAVPAKLNEEHKQKLDEAISFIEKKCQDEEEKNQFITCGLELLSKDLFWPFDTVTMENKRYFASRGYIPKLIQLMCPNEFPEVRARATEAVWNFNGSLRLGRIILSEGSLTRVIEGLQTNMSELNTAAVGALWGYLEYDGIPEKAMELNVLDSLIQILDKGTFPNKPQNMTNHTTLTNSNKQTKKQNTPLHGIGCILCLAMNSSCRHTMIAQERLVGMLIDCISSPSNTFQWIIIRFLAAVTLSLLMMDHRNHAVLNENNVLAILEQFVESNSPEEIAQTHEEVALNWKFMTPFFYPTLSTHAEVRRVAAFAMSTLARNGDRKKIIISEGLPEAMRCLQWDKDEKTKSLISDAIKLVYAGCGVTPQMIKAHGVELVPSLKEMCIYKIQHHKTLCNIWKNETRYSPHFMLGLWDRKYRSIKPVEQRSIMRQNWYSCVEKLHWPTLLAERGILYVFKDKNQHSKTNVYKNTPM